MYASSILDDASSIAGNVYRILTDVCGLPGDPSNIPSDAPSIPDDLPCIPGNPSGINLTLTGKKIFICAEMSRAVVSGAEVSCAEKSARKCRRGNDVRGSVVSRLFFMEQ
jgi:hypothetical protein